MSKVFRTRFIAALQEELPIQTTHELVNKLYKKNWAVYAKRPFNGPQSVIEYLGRYTHKIAISNHRLKKISDEGVTFSYKDYRQCAATKEMTLDALEFIRRFSMHILPKGFVRIRHFGIVSSSTKIKNAIQIKSQFPESKINFIPARAMHEIYNPKQCPCCKKETLSTILHFDKRGPPQDWKNVAKQILSTLN